MKSPLVCASTLLARMCRVGLVLALLVPAAPALSQTATETVKPFVMMVDGDPTAYGNRWGTLVYIEVFKRLNMPLQLEHYTLARRSALMKEGMADGEGSRVYAYGNDRPHLVRVEESVLDFSFALFAANPGVRLDRLEDLRASSYLVEHRRGILLCENTLKKWVPAERISDVLTHQQGLKKLQAGRTDLYCDIDVLVRQELQSPEFKGAAIRKLIGIGDAVPTFPYLHKKNAALAPRMAAVIKQMKAEGLIEAYRRQVERDLGWAN
jgi:hypothetical protein